DFQRTETECQDQGLCHHGQQQREHGQRLSVLAAADLRLRPRRPQRQLGVTLLGDRINFGDMLAALRRFRRRGRLAGRLVRQNRPTTLAQTKTRAHFVQGLAALWTSESGHVGYSTFLARYPGPSPELSPASISLPTVDLQLCGC